MTALAVLALVFLSFSHQPVSLASDTTDFASTDIAIISFCGDPIDGDYGHAGPCHACRASAAILPPAPCDAEPAYLGLDALHFAIANDAVTSGIVFDCYQSRAPPVAV